MDNETILGERFLGLLFFREKMRLRSDGFTHKGEFFKWADISEIKLFVMEDVFDLDRFIKSDFYKMIIKCPRGNISLDSRRLLYSNDKWTHFIAFMCSGQTPAFQQVRFEMETHCKEKIIKIKGPRFFVSTWKWYFWVTIVVLAVFVWMFLKIPHLFY